MERNAGGASITAAGLADLEAEVAELEGPRRREIAERIAAALGSAGLGEPELLTRGPTLLCCKALPLQRQL